VYKNGRNAKRSNGLLRTPVGVAVRVYTGEAYYDLQSGYTGDATYLNTWMRCVSAATATSALTMAALVCVWQLQHGMHAVCILHCLLLGAANVA
jgi:hypothetical protein